MTLWTLTSYHWPHYYYHINIIFLAVFWIHGLNFFRIKSTFPYKTVQSVQWIGRDVLTLTWLGLLKENSSPSVILWVREKWSSICQSRVPDPSAGQVHRLLGQRGHAPPVLFKISLMATSQSGLRGKYQAYFNISIAFYLKCLLSKWLWSTGRMVTVFSQWGHCNWKEWT